MRISDITLLFILPFLFLTSYAAPVLHRPSVDLAPRGWWHSLKNRVAGSAPRLGAVVGVTPPESRRHPGVVTGHTPDGNIEVAQTSHNLPPGKFPHQAPSQSIVPSAGLQRPSDKKTSYINTGKPQVYDKTSKHDLRYRKASIVDTMRLKWQQWKNSSHKP